MYNRIGRRRGSGVHDVHHGMFHRVYVKAEKEDGKEGNGWLVCLYCLND